MTAWRKYWESAVEFTAYLNGGEKKQAESWRYIYDRYHLADRQRRVLADLVRPMNVLTVAGLWCGDCSANEDLMRQTTDELLDEIERVQLMFQLSPRLTRLAAETAAR